jgi:hypothetical protein
MLGKALTHLTKLSVGFWLPVMAEKKLTSIQVETAGKDQTSKIEQISVLSSLALLFGVVAV